MHISNLAAQTGASLFLQTNALPSYSSLFLSNLTFSADHRTDWVYDKTENLSPAALAEGTYTHAIAEIPSLGRDWVASKDPQGVIEAFSGWSIQKDLKKLLTGGLERVLKMKKVSVLWILERKL